MNDLSFTVKRLTGREDAQQAYCCMTEVPSPWPQAVCQCRDWVTENLGSHVEGYHLLLDGKEVVGHLYFAMSENALFPYQTEPGVAVLYCDWVQRRFQDQGLGKRLFAAFIDGLKKDGARGVLVEATDIQGQMHFSHYQTRGFKSIYESGHRRLLYLPLAQDTVQFHPLHPLIRPRRGSPVEILILNGYLCPFEVATQVNLREVARGFGDQVVLRDIWLTPKTLEEFGVARGVFINGRAKLAGGETEDAIRRAIQEELDAGP